MCVGKESLRCRKSTPNMKTNFIRPLLLLVAGSVLCLAAGAKNKPLSDDAVRSAMRKATEFMVEKVSYNGGYLWNYSPDFSRQWGELEAKPTMMWIERGTPSMGDVFLDAYHATGDKYYLDAATQAAKAIMWAQLPCGGWNYMADFAGEASLKDWYAIVAKGYQYCAQEHLHYSANATFDDGTIDAATFLLRMYMEDYDPAYRASIDKALDFLIESQYPVGGWPQRYPLRYDFVKNGNADYSSFITINDGVHTNNILFLLDCYQMLGESRLLDPIRRAMTCVLVLQGGKAQAGWAMQHQLDLNYSPGHARDFEPRGYAATATAEMISDLMMFYQWTGDSKYLARIPDAFEFLESVKYGPEEVAFFGANLKEGQILCPTFVEVGTGKPLYLHRGEGKYWVDYDPHDLITHYRSTRTINIGPLRERYAELLAMSVEEATKDSPLLSTSSAVRGFAPFCAKGSGIKADAEEVRGLVDALSGQKPYWPGKLPGVSSENPGFSSAPLPSECISTWTYMQNITKLVNYLTVR